MARLYYLARGAGGATGVVYRIDYGATAPTITTQPSSRTVQAGAAVTFSVRASGPGPLQYQWRRDGVDIAGATAQDYTIAAVAQTDNGARFRALVTNDFGNALSNEAVLTVSSNQSPTGTITQPAAGTLYSGAMVINYAGTATDPEDGTLAASAFTWRVDFHHDTHAHPFIAATTGATSGSFTIPTTGETSANVWYRIFLTVRDSAGVQHTSQRDILPRKSRITLATNPAGRQLKLDGQPVATPLSFDSVVGIVRNIEAPTPQTAGATTYEFVSWSDGGAAASRHLDPGNRHDLHGDLPRGDGRRHRQRPVRRPTSTTPPSPDRRSRESTRRSISSGAPRRRRPASAPRRSACAGPVRFSRSSARPTGSTPSATTACACG